MNQIQTNKCLQCKKNKVGILFNTEKGDKFYCWDCLLPMLQKEREKCSDWERNKNKLFKEVIEKCRKKEAFYWPWRERKLENYGPSRWDRDTTFCPQCLIALHWDVTPYEDSKHICSYCANCDKDIGKNEQSKHFTWQETTPIYVCKKVKDSPCMSCDTVVKRDKGILTSWVSDLNKKVFSFTSIRPNSKSHCVLITRRHVRDMRSLNKEEWNDILPILQDNIKKIDRVYKPDGYRVVIPVGRLASQTTPHFFLRLIPKYKEDYGPRAHSRIYESATPEQIEKTKKALKPNAENIIAERSKVVARLHNETAFGYTVITTKQHITSDDFRSLDPEIWSQMGGILLDTIEELEKVTDCEMGFHISLTVGQKVHEILEREKGESRRLSAYNQYKPEELKLVNFPKIKNEKWWGRKFRPIEKGKPIGSMENERIVEKLRDPEGYYEKWKRDRDYLKHKAERERERERESKNQLGTLDLGRGSCCRSLYFRDYNNCNLV